MLPRRYIEEWKEFAQWPEDAQVEQDLVIEKALLQIFSEPYLQEHLAFRGGTALHKLFMKPQVRYSEDIDLVQIKKEPIKKTLDALHKQIQFLGKPSVKQKKNNNTMIYRFESEIPPVINLCLKIEINCREHFSVLGYKKIHHFIDNSWSAGSCSITTYEPEEMLGTKLRALYQRKKGRDLFDLFHALTQLDPDRDAIMKSYERYISFAVDNPPSQKEFLINMDKKLKDPDFLGDIYGLLKPEVQYDQNNAYTLVKKELIEKI
ncbi:MAG: nucleotidyl transferase AbiEii/AbiGii toxin family protein [Bacteroidota bacterium]